MKIMKLSSRSSPSGITVLIADSSRMGCQLLAAALKRSPQHINVVASAVNSTETLNAAKKHASQVALISANLQDGSLIGFKVLRELRAAHLKTRVIMLLDSPDRDLVVDAFRGGAHGVFCRADSIERLCKCVYSVHKGQIWASSNELQFLLEALAEAAPLRVVNAQGINLLTKREGQVTHLVAEGLTNREISRELKLSEHTVKNYLFRIFDKLGVSTRVELTLCAFSQRQAASEPLQHLLATSASG